MALTSKKRARPTTKSPNDGPDPLGFGATLAEIIAELQDAYRARLHAFLRKFTLVNSRRPRADTSSLWSRRRAAPSASTSGSHSIPPMRPVSFARTAH